MGTVTVDSNMPSAAASCILVYFAGMVVSTGAVRTRTQACPGLRVLLWLM